MLQQNYGSLTANGSNVHLRRSDLLDLRPWQTARTNLRRAQH